MKCKVVLTILTVLLLSLATGCWNRSELNDLAITVGLSIDRTDNDRYLVSAQIVEPGEVAEKGGSGRSPVTLFNETGNTVMEAIRKMTTNSPRKIYMAHLRILVIGEELAREGIGDVLDFMIRDHELRTDFFVAIAKGRKAKEMLTIMTPLEKLPAVKIYKSMTTSQNNWAPSLSVTLDKLIADLANEGKHPVLATLEATGDEKAGNNKSNMERIDVPASISSASLAVFKKDKLVGWLNETESKGYNYIINKISTTLGFMSCPNGGKIAVQVVRSNVKVKARTVDGEPIVDVDLRVKQNISEVLCRIDLTKEETFAEIDRRSVQKLEDILDSAIVKAQKQFKSDIFGFGDAVHRANPRLWKKLRKDWDRHFAIMPVHVKVKVQTTLSGTINNSLKNLIKE
ncbi:Ger(x)C family spore germination protein [Cohnella panacarvi]|uniref:Ger(x)C family spore germination protein n=1 Tax=Cohnella panacarvi TaxID=400776 RepID=UPI00047B22D6|nr:Ger(x)C family spore germination protein [Cohnella panacarvi]